MSDAAKQGESGATPKVVRTESKGKPQQPAKGSAAPPPPKEIGGPSGPEPTRYGDWERAGRCVDF
jgi:hypothetical protein